jgi:hypothetical protein
MSGEEEGSIIPNISPEARYGQTVVYEPVSEIMYAVGGYNPSTGFKNVVDMYSVSGSTITYLGVSSSAYPASRYYGGCAGSYNGNIYLLNGYTGSNTYGETVSKKWNGSTWSSMPNAPYPNSYAAYITIGTKVHITGGYHASAQGRYDSLYAFDMSTETWSTLDANAPGAGGTFRNAPLVGGAAYDGTWLWVIAGTTHDTTVYNRNNRWHLTGQYWDLTKGITGHPTTSTSNRWSGLRATPYYNGYIYGLGGNQESYAVGIRDLRVYKVATNSWHVYTDYFPESYGIYYGFERVGNWVYVFGGFNNSGTSNYNYAIDLTTLPTP